MTQHNKHFYKYRHAIMEYDVNNWSCGNKNLQMLIQVGIQVVQKQFSSLFIYFFPDQTLNVIQA